LRLIHPGDIVT